MTVPRLAWLVLAYLAVVPGDTHGNFGPGRGGSLGEPTGLKDVVIEHETLTLDMRPLEKDRFASISVRYDLRNTRSNNRLDLVFVAGNPPGPMELTLDGKAIPCTPFAHSNLPASWRTPESTPGIDTGPLRYLVSKPGVWSFQITLSPGKHRLEARYSALAGVKREEAATKLWQLAYILAPAREWAGFGRLDVTVLLPAGWRSAAEPQLERDGDMLTGSFDRIPADALALTVQHPIPVGHETLVEVGGTVFFGSLWLGPVVSLVAGVVIGRRLARRGRSGRRGLVPIILVSASLAVVMLVAGYFRMFGLDLLIPPFQSNIYPGVNVIVFLVATLLLFILDLAVAQIALFFTHKALAPHHPPLRGSSHARSSSWSGEGTP
jgi:hypothetical protein